MNSQNIKTGNAYAEAILLAMLLAFGLFSACAEDATTDQVNSAGESVEDTFNGGGGGGSGNGGGGGGSAGPLPDFSGVWRGTLVETTSGNTGDLTLTVEQNGADVHGTWSAIYSSGTANGGSLSGSVSSSAQTVSLVLDPSISSYCSVEATVAVENGEGVGNYATANCPYLLTGTIHVYRESLGGAADPPDSPVTLVVVGNSGRIELQWPAVDGASSYRVYRDEAPAVETINAYLLTVVSAGGDDPVRLSDTDVVNGTAYFYVVTALNAAGESAPSPEESATANP